MDQGHAVLNPKLPDDDFDPAVRMAQAECEQQRSDVVVGSSRGGAVAVNIDAGPALPGVEAMGYGQGGQARHGNPAFRGR